MKVAIIGAGLSGLSAAYRLEQLGFHGQLDIFEKKPSIGYGDIWLEFLSELFTRPITDFLQYLEDHYKLTLKPVQTVNKSYNYGPNRSSQLNNFLGYVVVRGGHHLALEKQLHEQINTKVTTNRFIHVEEIMDKYDRIIVATGNLTDLPKEIGIRLDRYVHFYMANIKGTFEMDSVKFWLNEEYAPKGYGYFLPLDEKEGMISLVTPSTDFNLDHAWKSYIEKEWANGIEIVNSHEIVNLALGRPAKVEYKNLLFVGLVGGAVTPFFGYGLHNSILSGFHAAEAIVHHTRYEDLLEEQIKEYKWSLGLRKQFEKLSDKHYDFLIDGMDSFIGKMVTKPNGINVLRSAGAFLNLFGNEVNQAVSSKGLLKSDEIKHKK